MGLNFVPYWNIEREGAVAGVLHAFHCYRRSAQDADELRSEVARLRALNSQLAEDREVLAAQLTAKENSFSKELAEQSARAEVSLELRDRRISELEKTLAELLQEAQLESSAKADQIALTEADLENLRSDLAKKDDLLSTAKTQARLDAKALEERLRSEAAVAAASERDRGFFLAKSQVEHLHPLIDLSQMGAFKRVTPTGLVGLDDPPGFVAEHFLTEEYVEPTQNEMASYIACLGELRKKAFDEDLFINVRHPEDPNVYDLTNKLLGMYLSPEMDAILRDFLCFVEEIQELCRRELDLLEEKETVITTLETVEEGPEKQELSRKLCNLEYVQYRLEFERTEQRKEYNIKMRMVVKIVVMGGGSCSGGGDGGWGCGGATEVAVVMLSGGGSEGSGNSGGREDGGRGGVGSSSGDNDGGGGWLQQADNGG
ncbi:uncharacterized protein LOC130744809 [Lotus japonicus]|uniref:uncharacterized protein LOC130744809 n=1 Tax=Lotus japonicus TaxID=34305 RepID=UPI00258699B3|nr:uncharacterized protein LOC130744809 [Lotus japonicus]